MQQQTRAPTCTCIHVCLVNTCTMYMPQMIFNPPPQFSPVSYFSSVCSFGWGFLGFLSPPLILSICLCKYCAHTMYVFPSISMPSILIITCVYAKVQVHVCVYIQCTCIIVYIIPTHFQEGFTIIFCRSM